MNVTKDPCRTLRRRTFLAAAAGGIAGTLVSSLGSAPTAGAMGALADPPEEKQPWRMRLSTSSIHYMGLPIEQACERIAALGFEAIDIWSAHQGCPHLDDVAQRLGADGLKNVLRKHNLELYAFSTYRGGYARYAKLLGDAGGGVAIQGSTKPCKPDELSARMREFQDSLKPLLDLAEEHDSHLAIENHQNALLDSLDSLKAFVDINQSPRLGIALAPYHIQGLEEPVEQAIEICGEQLFFFYAWQRAGGMKQLPGHGPADFTPWLAALEKIRYRHFVNPFMHGHPEPEEMSRALAKSREYLRACHAGETATPVRK